MFQRWLGTKGGCNALAPCMECYALANSTSNHHVILIVEDDFLIRREPWND